MPHHLITRDCNQEIFALSIGEQVKWIASKTPDDDDGRLDFIRKVAQIDGVRNPVLTGNTLRFKSGPVQKAISIRLTGKRRKRASK